ncbi:GreA/GreB family elongation factor [Algivirga pacifica]|uniref:Transcription elongation factor GreA n=1 Tax=Algivirga pacifica TaxID=1162670 RepID=A0ABP9D2D5_9BACT
MDTSILITKEGFDQLNQEMKALWDERKIVTEAVSEAAAMGDRSENAEYIYGKKKLRELDRRIGYLHKRTQILKIFTPAGKEGQACFGRFVKFKDETGRSMEFRLVGKDEADTRKKTLSIMSPIGKALWDKFVGDSVQVQTPAGRKTFTIEAVR